MTTETNHFLPVAPVPPPTTAQALAFALTDLAKCKARLHRLKGKAMEATMWLGMGESQRATELINSILTE